MTNSTPLLLAQFNAGAQNDMQLAYDSMSSMFNGPYGALVKIVFWSEANPTGAWIITVIYLVALLLSIAHILITFRGSDRICWLLTASALPIAGLTFYWFIGINQIARETESDYIKRMSSR